MKDPIKCSALAATRVYSHLVGYSHRIRVKGGKVLYEYAKHSLGSDKVRLVRFDKDVYPINRYIPWDTPVELVPMESK